MATEGDVTETTEAVQTYVPAYQKKTWRREADELDMNLSEFVRSMVQAGRSEFSLDEATLSQTSNEESRATPSSDHDSGGQGLEDRVASILSDGGFYEWDELVAELNDNLEDRLEEALQELQARDRVRYSGRHGGYTIE